MVVFMGCRRQRLTCPDRGPTGADNKSMSDKMDEQQWFDEDKPQPDPPAEAANTAQKPAAETATSKWPVVLGAVSAVCALGVLGFYGVTQTSDTPTLSDRQTALASVYPMQAVPAGTYTVGCTPGQGEACADDEKPVHDVVLSQPFLVGETEVTQALYQETMGANPSQFVDCGTDCPVENVTWMDAIRFANRLSTAHGLPKCYAISGQHVTMPNGLHCGGFRLPTEAEWEVAARGGQDLKYSGSDNIEDVAWFRENSNTTTHPVRQKQPNNYGLYDMSGNVWEWSWDTYTLYTEGVHEQTPELAVLSDGVRVGRGGCWGSHGEYGSRISYRDRVDPNRRLGSLGVRLVLSMPVTN